MTKTMFGTVTNFDGRYFVVVCPNAPAHLATLNLVKGQMSGAVVGDEVRLEYQVTSRSGLWNVVEVIEPVECLPEHDDPSTWTEAQERERYEAEVFQAQLDEDAYWAAKEAAHLAVEEYEAKEEANLAGSQDILF
jgi:hypothetical protein